MQFFYYGCVAPCHLSHVCYNLQCGNYCQLKKIVCLYYNWVTKMIGWLWYEIHRLSYPNSINKLDLSLLRRHLKGFHIEDFGVFKTFVCQTFWGNENCSKLIIITREMNATWWHIWTFPTLSLLQSLSLLCPMFPYDVVDHSWFGELVQIKKHGLKTAQQWIPR